MTRSAFLAVFMFVTVGLVACKGDGPTAPVAPNYVVSFDTTTMNLDAMVGEGWGFGLNAVIAGGVDVPSVGDFEYRVDRPSLVKTKLTWFNRSSGWSQEVRMYTTNLQATLEVSPLATGTVIITIWPSDDSRLKRKIVMKITQMPMPTKGG